MINVVCGIIYKGDRIFIARRKAGKSMAGKWEFPGGKVERGESEEMALKRELLEELGMLVTVKNKLGSNVHAYKDFKINLVAYKCDFVNASFKLTDHDRFEWVTPKELLNYDLTAADIPLVELFV
ncbi:(deoxy)nucleoside triphosphate pyrophosphohydrolase [Algibacter mikhailovii]|uniref:8-oxo-dGTP diphosphatase n=1 Tax=Algibacter mikhailovii TaxID=425498 RepID=A0A918R8H6_9FLAO|nr:(deoxy)nucleoside triphosphate pyrophosphohydrolase [Algibacter mikhailovii]GGZ88254.1 NUDIX hydrolase [Algibacter mikhailovii]